VDVTKSFQSYLITGLDRLLWLQEVEAPRVFRQSAHEVGKVVRPTHLPPAPHPQEVLLVPISVTGLVDPRAIVRPEELSQ